MISWEQVHSKDMARRRNELSRFLNLQNLTSLTKEVTRWAKFFFLVSWSHMYFLFRFLELWHEHDITYVDVDKNYGAKATTNAWEPKIKINKQNEFIFSQIWLLSDLFGQYLISIEAGWQVYSDVNMILFLMSCIMICVCFTTS